MNIAELLDKYDNDIPEAQREMIAQHTFSFFRLNPAGRTLWRLFEDLYVNQSSFDENPNFMYFKEGRRHLFLQLQKLIREHEETMNERIIENGTTE